MAVLWLQRGDHWSLYGWMLLLLMLSMRFQLSLLQVVCHGWPEILLSHAMYPCQSIDCLLTPAIGVNIQNRPMRPEGLACSVQKQTNKQKMHRHRLCVKTWTSVSQHSCMAYLAVCSLFARQFWMKTELQLYIQYRGELHIIIDRVKFHLLWNLLSFQQQKMNMP